MTHTEDDRQRDLPPLEPEVVGDPVLPYVHEPSRSRGIGRNTAINVVGGMAPLLLSILTVPAYLHLIGQDRYGVLAIVWVVLGYFGVFDLGLSRATANQIARMRDRPPEDRERVFWSAITVNATVGALGGALLLLLGHVLLGHLLHVSADLRHEALGALPWLAVSVPLTTVTLVLAGTLEGRERFLTVNILSTVGLAMFQLAPLAQAYWVGPSLSGLVMAATFALVASTALSFIVIAVSLPLRGLPVVDVHRLGELLRYGGWITVTGLVGPLLTVVDRVVIGGVLGARAVAQYTVPSALVARAQILSSGLARTLFPRFSHLDHGDAADVGRESLSLLAAVMTPICIVGAVCLRPFLDAWVGSELAAKSAPVGEILLLGMWLNSLAVVPYAFLQAKGRPDLPAKFHVLEVAPYFGGLLLGLHVAGLDGAALGRTGRAPVDPRNRLGASARLAPDVQVARWRHLGGGLLLVVAATVTSLSIFDTPELRMGLGSLLIILSFVWAWRVAGGHIRLVVLRWRPS
jgi:O-antigen/teichoic acid export membrane protein